MVQGLQGITIGRYQLGRRIGKGAMGDVYLAEDTHRHIDRQVAIKVIPLPPDDDDVAVVIQLFEREVKGITALNHPHVIHLFDYDVTQWYSTKIAYLVMPYYEDGSLDKWCKEHRLSPQDATHFIMQAASVLQCMHDLPHSIVHKDVKPSNFLLRKNIEHPERPDLLLADFGVVKLSTGPLSLGNMEAGSPAYMAPEQWKKEPLPASDQYALAIMAYELLTAGERPFKSNNREELKELHLTKQALPPSTFNPRIPKALDAVILRALSKNPEQRYPSISAFANAFGQAAYSEEKGDDIHLLLTLSEAEVLVDTTHQLYLPQGDVISITIPAGTKNGEQLSFEGKGAPSRFTGPAGTLVVTVLTRPDTSNEQIIIQQLQAVTQRLDKLDMGISTVVPVPYLSPQVAKQAEQGGQQSNDKSQVDALLKDFEFSPLRFDRFILRNWHIPTVDVYAILLTLLILLNWYVNEKHINYFHCAINTHLNCINSVNDLLAWNNILVIVSAALVLLVFNRWQREIAPTFRKLLDKRYVSLPKGEMNIACSQFLSAYKDVLKSPKRYLLYGLALTATLVYLLSAFTGPLQSAFVLEDPLLQFIVVCIQLLFGLGLLALAYCVGVVAWIIAVTAWQIKKLTRKFDFFIVPNHPDKCGGLKFLGTFCLGMAFPLLIGGVVLGVFSIEAYFSESTRFYSLMSSIALVLFALPLAFLVLYNTLWDIHLKMVKEAEKAEENFALLILGLKSEMQSSLEKHMWENAKMVKDKIELAQIVNPDTITYPTWPFDRSILLTFWTPQTVPILGLFLNLTAPISDALKALITLLSHNH